MDFFLNFREFVFPVKLSIADSDGLIRYRDWLTEAQVPSCPKCGSPMVLRTARQSGSQFYGCSQFPKCKGIVNTFPTKDAVPNPTSQAQPNPTVKQPAQVITPWWYYGQVIATHDPRFAVGAEVAMTQEGGNWKYVDLKTHKRGTLLGTEIASVVKSLKDSQGKPLATKTPSIDDLNKRLRERGPYEPATVKPKSNLIDVMSDEQEQIDAKFEQLMKNPGQSHMMIGALAGTGKTTTLKHLAWKYGNNKQKWLYLVFNKKNQVEAIEKFPPFVKVRTTNSFLGEVLQDKGNFSKIPQTERIVNLNKYKKGANDDRLEKIRLLADTPQFETVQKSLKLPMITVSASEYGKMAKTLNSLLNSIRYEFKEQVILLVGLAKSFALDVRNPEAYEKGIDKILDSYDFDTDLPDIKERIERYSGSFRDTVIQYLEELLGYDFMMKNYVQEIRQAAKWMLTNTMPHGTDATYKHGPVTHKLGEFRDFSDDLWFAAVHSDQIQWPKFDVVLADEVQDFNEAQKIMLKKLHDQGAKIVAVGDVNQSIYRFRGADTGAFSNIENQLKDLSHNKDISSSLTKNYRSKKVVLDFANSETHVKNLRPGTEKQNEGGEATKYKLEYEDAFNSLAREKASGKIKQTAFIARTNEPLVHAALSLLVQNIPFVILGKDVSGDLKKHISKMISRFAISDHADVSALDDKMTEFLDNETDYHAGKSTKASYLQELNEVTQALQSVMDQFLQSRDTGTIGDFKKWLSEKFGGLDVEENEEDLKKYKDKMAKENPVVLTTAHKSKGLEFERVYILRYDLFPHKKAKREEDLAQEENAKYVSLTRARDEIHVLKLDGQPGYKKK